MRLQQPTVKAPQPGAPYYQVGSVTVSGVPDAYQHGLQHGADTVVKHLLQTARLEGTEAVLRLLVQAERYGVKFESQ